MKFRETRWLHQCAVGVLRHGRRETAFIVNVSDGGARLTGISAPQLDEVFTLHAFGRMIPATVRWVKETDCGVQFSSKLTVRDQRNFTRAIGPKPGARGARRIHGFTEIN